MWRDIDKARSEYHVLMVPKNTVPPDARLAECYETSREWVVVGEPWRGEDESDPRYHNCDTMGCGTLFHVVARIQKPKGHTVGADRPDESKPSIAKQKTCPSCKHRFIPSFNVRCPKCGHNLTPGTTCAAESGSPSSPAMSTRRRNHTCPTCKQDMREDPHDGLDGKECPQCGQGMSWRRAKRKQANDKLPILENREGVVVCSAPAGDVIACRYCKLRMTLAEVKTWVGCDACNDGEDWLKAAIQNASSPPTKLSDGSANNQ